MRTENFVLSSVREGAGRKMLRGWGILAAAAWIAVAAGFWGCGSSAPAAGTSVGGSEPITPPPPPITTDRGNIFNVTITTQGGQILVDKLEIEFNRRRGIHDLYGFFFDNYSEMSVVPFADLERVDFRGQMPEAAFEQASVGREDKNLHLQNAFEVELTYRSGRKESFYAVIPMFRGEKDMTLWEFSMDSNTNPILYIEFDR